VNRGVECTAGKLDEQRMCEAFSDCQLGTQQVSVTMPMIKCMQTCKQDGNEQSFGDKNAGKQPREEKILRYHQINELETSQL